MTNRPAHPDSSGAGSNKPRHPRTDADRRMDALINRILDAESDGELHVARGLQAHGAEIFPGFAARIEATRDALGRLTVLPETPDFARAILAKVALSPANVHHSTSDESHEIDDALLAPIGETDDQPWEVPSFGRRERTFSATRLAMAAGVVGAIAFAVMLNRFAPVPAAPVVGPVGEVVAASRADLADTSRSLAGAIFSLGDDLMTPLPAAFVPPRPRSLTLGDASKYEASLGASAFSSPLASGSTRMLAIVDGPVSPTMRRWQPDLEWLSTAVASPAAPAFASEASLDQPRIHAWKLYSPNPGGPISIIRHDLSWAELDALSRPAPGDPAEPPAPMRN
ncbi:MAG: hypothetical protein WC718_03920 [Phycisphaerales bacterium]|jgi:hypothetical protein